VADKSDILLASFGMETFVKYKSLEGNLGNNWFQIMPKGKEG